MAIPGNVGILESVSYRFYWSLQGSNPTLSANISLSLRLSARAVFRLRAALAALGESHLLLTNRVDGRSNQLDQPASTSSSMSEPRAVIAGHKRVGNDDSPRIIGETRKYIRDFERLAMQTTTARALYDEMLTLYSDWINRGALWSSVLAVKTSV
jgi:hypothetical protein